MLQPDGRLIFKDQMGQFWQPGPVEQQKIVALDHQGDRAASFVINDQKIYTINSQHQLWSYDLNTNNFTLLGAVHEDVEYLTDVDAGQLLLSIKVAAKKLVVKLTVSQ